MSLETCIAFALACIVIVLVPGPTVTLIIASSMRHGTRAGLLNVAGTQAGLAVLISIVGVGLASTIEAMGHWFEWVRLIGAAYLIWIGLQMIRSRGKLADGAEPAAPRGGFFLQGFLVSISNPKTLLFFSAFLPQFIDPSRDYFPQIAIMGVTMMTIAALSDSSYAVIAGKAGRMLSARRVKLLSRVSGGFLVGGGLWLALSRAK
jgi:threonine/homoserine/homoserine lactone efflux protein